ncbi:MAG TPA: aldehyde dehydrogenase family protein [Methylomirabilota bacterium]|jgi:betaine-aldehyde dehydrogenase|nr:aldehyde dehydrogenase family protein [Methylomirabilota bacterium]
MASNTDTLRLPLRCPLVVDGDEGKASSGRQFSRENPADFRQVATVAEQGTLEDARAAIDAARTAFDSNAGNWIYNYKLREQVLFRTARLIRDNADRLAAVVSLEVGMPMRQAVPHVGAAADIFEFYAGLAGKLYGESFTLPSGSTINLVREPVGVVGMITPWNFPLTQSARKVAPALAAGCTLVIKPASYTPAATYELVKLIHQTGLPKGVVNLVPGPGNVVGTEIIANKKVDKISFTGETSTGKMIGSQAGMEVKRVSLELGGKAPYVIFDDADVEAASRAAIFGMFRNAGQACGATTRLLVQAGIHDRFLARVAELTRKIEVGHPSKQSTDMGPLISSNQERVVQDYIKYGVDAGFRLVTGGRKLQGGDYDHGYYVEPTIFAGVDNASRLGQEEIFGPVVAVTTFHDEAEAVELANAVDFGLVAGVWSADYPRALRVARRIRAGTVWIWDNYAQPVEGIWGGYKQSGMGRELGYHGLNDFLEIKQIFTDGTGLATKPAYGQVIKE